MLNLFPQTPIMYQIDPNYTFNMQDPQRRRPCLTYFYAPSNLQSMDLSKEKEAVQNSGESTASNKQYISHLFGSGISSAFKHYERGSDIASTDRSLLSTPVKDQPLLAQKESPQYKKEDQSMKMLELHQTQENIHENEKKNVGLQNDQVNEQQMLGHKLESIKIVCSGGELSHENPEELWEEQLQTNIINNRKMTQSPEASIRLDNILDQNIEQNISDDIPMIKEEIEEDDDEDSDKEELLLQQLDDIGNFTRNKCKTFDGVPKQWHQTIRIRNPETQRVKLFFKCKYPNCGSVFKKSCNLRDHFRKHTGLRPFKCPFCQKTFTQSGNLGRHLKNVHGVSRESVQLDQNQ